MFVVNFFICPQVLSRHWPSYPVSDSLEFTVIGAGANNIFVFYLGFMFLLYILLSSSSIMFVSL